MLSFFQTWLKMSRLFVYSAGRAIVIRNVATTQTTKWAARSAAHWSAGGRPGVRFVSLRTFINTIAALPAEYYSRQIVYSFSAKCKRNIFLYTNEITTISLQGCTLLYHVSCTCNYFASCERFTALS